MFKITRKTALRLYVAAIALSLGVVAFVAVTSDSDAAATPDVRPSVTPLESRTVDFPRCSDASGRYDNNCWYEDKPNGVYLSFNYGETFVVLRNGDVIENGPQS